MRSMTGFGRSILTSQSLPDAGGKGKRREWSLTWEIRSVNGRHLDVKWRIPSSLRQLEQGWEKLLRGSAARGRVDVHLHLQVEDASLLGVTFNSAQADAMIERMRAFSSKRAIAFLPDCNWFFGISQLWEDDLREPDPDLAQHLRQGLVQCLEDWNASRSAEGKALVLDLEERLARIREWTGMIRERAPGIKEEKFRVFQGRIQEILDRYAVEADQGRLLQEAAVLGDKLDISEELTRLTTHLELLGKLLRQGGEAGKRLDFTLQECFREINTCGNKAQDADISRIVVECKAELEKCREQVQNIE